MEVGAWVRGDYEQAVKFEGLDQMSIPAAALLDENLDHAMRKAFNRKGDWALCPKAAGRNLSFTPPAPCRRVD
jgi:hypothetical protein